MYADIGPSSFNRQSHQKPHLPVLDDDPIQYAQIKHNLDHAKMSSMPQNMQPPFRADFCGMLPFILHFPGNVESCHISVSYKYLVILW